MVKSLTISLTVGLALIAATASAQRRDPAGERQLVTTEMTIDANAADAGSGRVTGKIVEQWAGTQFTFEEGGTPRELTEQDVQDYRAKGLGYGGISILLALAAKQDGTNPQSLDQILAMRQTDKMGWGNIAKALGYDSLGEVVRSVKAADASVRNEARAAARSERSVRAERMDRPEKADKPEKVEKMNRPERLERIERKSK